MGVTYLVLWARARAFEAWMRISFMLFCALPPTPEDKHSHNAYRMAKKKTQPPTGLSPIIKWPGGKEKELKYIFSNAPAFNRYFEPFVGGGSVFMGVNAKEYFINDFSSELIELYRNIGSSDKDF